MSYPDFATEHARRLILEALEKDPDYEHNEEVIRGELELYGHRFSHDKLRTELHWLAEQGLVGLEKMRNPDLNLDLLLVRLTARGEDVVLGRTRVPGVARKLPLA